MNIQSVCVCGAGTMGSGIAQVCAQSGLSVVLYDLNDAVLAKGKESIEKNLDYLVSRNKITAEEKARIYSHIQFTRQLNDCVADLVIEAIVEKVETKIALFNQLAEVNHSETIFATNTSSLSVSVIAAGVMHPQRVVGMHFFNPAPLMKLVEVVKGSQTSDSVVNTIIDLTRTLGKTPVVCKDAPGFIVNHVARPYYLESLRILEMGHSDVQTIDTLLEATGFKMGPFRLMDLIGNDVNYAVSKSVYEQMGKPERLMPSPIQQQKVESGQLGKKAGKGYYEY